MKIKEFSIFIFFTLSLLLVYVFFPINNTFQQILIMVVFFGIVPILFNKIIFKKELKDIGLGIGDWKQGFFWSGIFIITVLVLLFISSYFFGFLKYYNIPNVIVYDFREFIWYEITTVIFLIFIYEFFFRGFIMLNIKKVFSFWAILAQMVIFVGLIFFTSDYVWTLAPYIVFSILSGVIVYKSQSIFYSVLAQFLMMIILDASMVYFIR
jgi:membrane protease YdiL (CAAX protease family)